MAESTGSKNKKTLDAFADDLDAMLNIGDPSEQQVGTIDDDEAIDRLLVGDETFERNAQQEIDEFADIDELLSANEPGAASSLASDIDEFGDDLDSDIGINPGREQQVIDDEFADIVDAENRQDRIELADTDVFEEVAELERVGQIDDFVEDTSIAALILPETAGDELENMAEIDEFSDDAESVGSNADFLIADFDISADDELAPPAPPNVDDFADSAEPNASVQPSTSEPDPGFAAEASYQDNDEELVVVQSHEPEIAPVAEAVERVQAAPPVQVIDHSSEIAALNRNIVDIKKHQQQIRHDLTEAAGKNELLGCLDSLESLQTEQKKTKRAVDALAAKKPVSAYVANGIAVAALLIGSGLGIQGMIAKSQVGELVTIIGKLQEQVNVAPASDAADKEMLRKQLDELTVSNGVMATQIAELSKVGPADPGAAKAAGDQAKPSAEISSQMMQIGAAIEALQNKVSALEKGRAVAVASVPKPEKKKPEPVEENWAVNLVAFKQDWYAKSKAQEFAGKGVPAKVVKTESKGENWYRLFVDGFKTQYEAASYAAKIKKTLNLDSVWVTRNKE
ncbi:Sporulation domain-containing protein [Methylomonas albis]|uniref:SPOR domain-containing protein n=1 Tax=Methylomonas albis TaxID=1854563 RepID=A0ABR9CX84_9GAMM|nr:SPOR domain-containing protein [Methylomonas albis]MBD9355335.1 SPOR domain-containing protein [Methylomonas albis]CAD6878298.1 Sporulation domain-containing protein [Methylomonas albis]